MPRRTTDRAVTGHEWNPQLLRQCHKGGVICREVVTQLPYTSRQTLMGIACDGKVGPIGLNVIGSLLTQLAVVNQSTQGVEHFNVHQVRRMEIPIIAEAGDQSLVPRNPSQNSNYR